MKKPPESVQAVMSTDEPTAGSRPKRERSQGIATPIDAASHFGEVFAQRVALFDYALKSQVASARRLAAALTPGTGSRALGR